MREIFLQRVGGPIGLRSTCAVARITMSYWDKKWLETMKENNVTIRKSDRYMDDLRATQSPGGWRTRRLDCQAQEEQEMYWWSP